MSFKDVLKKSFISNYSAADMTAIDITVILGITLFFALYIFFVYRILTRKSFYNKSFNISLAALALITAAIIIAIQTSVVVSLGMVGALSIVRFRTAVKDPLDLVFLFWSIAIGIICGVGLYSVAAIMSVVVTVMVFVLDKLPVAKAPIILVVQASYVDMEKDIISVVEKYTKYFKVKSRNITPDQLNIIVELRMNDNGQLVQELCELDGIEYASMIDHDGEVTF